MNVAFIPVRGGSKSIPRKNIKMLCGKPLVYWVVKAACEAQSVDRVFVSTDNEDIRSVVEAFDFHKLSVISRSAETATDEASTESAMLEFAHKYDFEHIILLQATSPLTTSKDIDNGMKLMSLANTDSVVSVINIKRFLWEEDKLGFAHTVNFDYFERPRRQDFEGAYVENGAIFVTTRKNLIINKNRIGGNIRLLEMSEKTYYEVDELSDWPIIENLLQDSLSQCYEESCFE